MTAEPRPRQGPVIVIDDHDLLSVSLVLVLQRAGLDARRLPVRHREEIVADAGPTSGGVAVVDLNLGSHPGQGTLHGHEIIPSLRGSGWRVLAMSGSATREALADAVVAGAEGIVDKSSSTDAFVASIRRLLAGEDVMELSERDDLLRVARQAQMRRTQSAAVLDRLTHRERQVLERLAEGYRAAAIAEEFVVSLTTVRSQIRAVLGKLGVGSQLEAVALLHASSSL
ncbi:LuxR C-terminal-related transcriptional regulator [Actinomycetospora sp. TBRC 11914]|uniref:LuxR C-terminal-related transcriptional regulator n=1 Tax=Actinomycetospora sp. TBRC 11914 TaxID=2729387 RepID=UPI00145C9CDC|nr:LuxR C-terminal-related transcriptional regulator [Actinomycetospora sp. TBRC 11914]NMO90358.1 response regulator transcription factor [Actinomycetospora sp. TBRC 11914]